MAEIKIQKIVCPSCGGSFEPVDLGHGEVRCKYCKTLVIIDRKDTQNGKFTIYNKADNKLIGHVDIPLGWDLDSTTIDYNRCTRTYPYAINVSFKNTTGSVIYVENGEGFTELGMVGIIGRQPLYTVQRPFIPINQYLDEVALGYANATKSKISKVEERELPLNYEINKAEELEKTQRKVQEELNREMSMSMQKVDIRGLYTDFMCKVYTLDTQNGQKKMALYTKLIGSKAGLSMLSLFNGNRQNSNEESIPNLIGNLNRPGQGESLHWYTENMFVLISNPDEFENVFANAYKQICSSFVIDQSVLSEQEMMRQQIAMQDSSNINAQAQSEQRNLNMMQQAAQRQRVANQQYVDSMRARSNQQYQSQRDSYNSRIAAQDRMRDARSEATRGVNTYIRPDGTEVEVPVSADTAWINSKGEIVGGSAGFNPGAGWTKMERKN